MFQLWYDAWLGASGSSMNQAGQAETLPAEPLDRNSLPAIGIRNDSEDHSRCG
jgi:hypothetical protein